mgnify:CR=1 FL=1
MVLFFHSEKLHLPGFGKVEALFPKILVNLTGKKGSRELCIAKVFYS